MGDSATVISSEAEKEKYINAIDANAAIGRLDDTDFLTKTFTGADIVYLMEPAPDFLIRVQTSPHAGWVRIKSPSATALAKT